MPRRLLRIAIGIYLAWLVLVLLVAMPLANWLAPRYMQSEYGRDLRTDLILINPFGLAVEVRGAALDEPDGSAFASLDIARVNLSLASLWQRGIVFDDITVSGLDIHLRRQADGSLNIDDFLTTDPSAAPEAGDDAAAIPGLTIAELHFQANRIALTDAARETPFSTHYDALSIDVRDLSTVMVDGNPYEIDVFAESGGSLHWRGTVSLPRAESNGRLEVRELSLVTFWRYAAPWLNFELADGALSLAGDYRLSWADALRYAVDGGSLRVDNVQIRAREGLDLGDTRVHLASVALGDITVDSDSAAISAGTLSLNGLDVSGWSEGESVSLATLFDLSGLPADEAGDSEPPPADAAGSAPAWTAQLDGVALDNSRAQWRSEYTDPPLLVIEPLQAGIEQLRWPPAGDSPLTLSLAVNGQTTLQVDGAADLGSGAGTIDYQLAGLPLSWANPNLPEPLHATITDGQLEVQGQLSLADFLPARVAMDGAIRNFSGQLAEEGVDEALTRWDKVRWQQLVVDLDARTVSLAQLLIHDYEGRIHIREDGSVNASNIWQEEVGERAGDIAHDLELDQPWQVDVPEILITSSAIDFMDESLPLPFRTVIGDVNGEIRDISTDPSRRTAVDIKGEVDGYAPVTLKGDAAPLLEPPALDLALTFTGVDLVLLTPYSGTYAGYAIERGLLNMELDYQLQDNHLVGRNDIVIDRLKLGDKVDSDRALDLPLELALALLTDVNGIIDLKVPVEGDVDDPQFAIGSVIAGAFINLITKAVTAPFALLANLVGADDDLQRLPFAVGSSELTETGVARLKQLAEALTQRPQLVLVISGRLNREADTRQLQAQALTRQLVEEGLAQVAIETRDPAFQRAIADRYAGLGGDTDAASFAEQYDAVLAAITVDTAQLEQLIQQRAVTVKEYLVNTHNLPADRAVVEVAASLDDADGYSGVVLDLTN